jgi:XTP/dITP diphosphohydrolase
VTAALRVVVATTNPGKIREIAGILNGLSRDDGSRVELVSLRDLPEIPEPEETGLTFAENSRLKARYYAHAPGVHSARWHGTDYRIKFRKIYELLAARGVSGSPARFVCHVTLASPDAILFESEGIVKGEIAAEPRGTNGFGYDPIFFYPPFGCTLAELDLERKAAVSHRGQAFAALRKYLAERRTL